MSAERAGPSGATADEIRDLTVVATIVDGIPAYRGDPVTYSPLED